MFKPDKKIENSLISIKDMALDWLEHSYSAIIGKNINNFRITLSNVFCFNRKN